METLKQNHEDVETQWRSFELRPAGSPPMPDWYMERIRASRPQLYQTAREHYGLELNQGPYGINSHKAHLGGKYAEAQGRGEAYHKAVMDAYWLHAEDISDESVLIRIAMDVGLDSQGFRSALDDAQYEREVQMDVTQAQMYQLNGVPALIFNEKYLVSGAQPYHVLEQVTDRARQDGA